MSSPVCTCLFFVTLRYSLYFPLPCFRCHDFHGDLLPTATIDWLVGLCWPEKHVNLWSLSVGPQLAFMNCESQQGTATGSRIQAFSVFLYMFPLFSLILDSALRTHAGCWVFYSFHSIAENSELCQQNWHFKLQLGNWSISCKSSTKHVQDMIVFALRSLEVRLPPYPKHLPLWRVSYARCVRIAWNLGQIFCSMMGHPARRGKIEFRDLGDLSWCITENWGHSTVTFYAWIALECTGWLFAKCGYYGSVMISMDQSKSGSSEDILYLFSL